MPVSNQPVHVLAFCGSLRKASFNRALLRAAHKVAPEGVTIEDYDIAGIPPFNQDVLDAGGYPAPCQDMRARIKAADAILFVTPEYNFSVPGVLKNAIDWASRPPEPPFTRKPCAIMGASGGAMGTSRAQYHLRQMCVFLDMFPINKPEVLVTFAAQKFDKELNLTDEAAAGFVKDLLGNLRDWTNRLRG
jgi:chromate reductase